MNAERWPPTKKFFYGKRLREVQQHRLQGADGDL